MCSLKPLVFAVAFKSVGCGFKGVRCGIPKLSLEPAVFAGASSVGCSFKSVGCSIMSGPYHHERGQQFEEPGKDGAWFRV